jgi:hypothetical protein
MERKKILKQHLQAGETCYNIVRKQGSSTHILETRWRHLSGNTKKRAQDRHLLPGEHSRRYLSKDGKKVNS